MAANRVESLVGWYLRFNGYLTVPNFTIYPDTKKGSEAEADLLAVRFPSSTERAGTYEFERDPGLVTSSTIDFLIVEAKSGECILNTTWTEPARHSVHYALKWWGDLPETSIEDAAAVIYSTGRVEYSHPSGGIGRTIRLAAFGRYLGETSKSQKQSMPDLLQIQLATLISFVQKRLTLGCARLHRENWDPYIRDFAILAELGATEEVLLQWTLGRRIGA